MALFSCPECGTEFNYKAKTCPHCGCSLGKPTLQVKEPPLCSNCGFQLSDGVSYCPKCGTKVTLDKEPTPKPVEESQKQDSNKGCWWGCSIIIIILGIFGAITDESDGNDASGKLETDNLVEKVVNVFSSDNKEGNSTNEEESNIPGTYEVTDEIGQTLIFTLKKDNTATVKIKGEEGTYYCSWEPNDNNDISLDFSDEPPALMFNGGITETMYCPEISDGWLYYNYDALKAKNPKRRLPIRKIK
jgi:hypothetical protein